MENSAWGQLVSSSDILADPVVIAKSKFTIGRSKGADLSLAGNKLVSGTHCFIEKDKDGTVWLQDTSTNGTLLNFHKKLVGTKEELRHGDEIHLIYKKSEEHLNVSYVFQDLLELAKEEAGTTKEDIESPNTSRTIPYEDDSETIRKRLYDDSTDDEEGPEKKSKLDDEKEEKLKALVTSEAAGKTDTKLCDAVVEDVSSKENKNEPQEKVETDDKNTKSETKSTAETSKEANDAIEETLICIICQEIFHDCVSCQPCMHTFCGGCYSGWMKRSAECPACRLTVKQVSRNHVINNMVEIFLKSHPERKRPESELKLLDSKNTIRAEIVTPMPETTLEDSLDNDPHYDEEDEDEEEYENSEDALPPASGFGFGLFGRAAPFPFTGMTGALGTIRPPRTICRQCPGHPEAKASTSIALASKAVGDAIAAVASAVLPGTSTTDGEAGASTKPEADDDVKVMPEPPDFTCSPTQNHILCSCCLQALPDRRGDYARHPATVLPPTQCALCHRTFCHQYWGCRKDSCLGCIGKFKEINFGKKILDGVILTNTYESDILKNFMKENSMTTKHLLTQCCNKLINAEFTTLDQVRGFTADSVTCYACGLRNFREMAYQFRREMKADDLPLVVTSRPQCHWGRNCRTQKTNVGHAARYNHICEQTKT